VSAEKKFPLSLIIRAIDQVSGPLAAITTKINAATGPMGGLGKKFSAFGEAINVDGFAKVGGALADIGSTAFGLITKFAGLAAGAGLAFGAVIKGAMDAGDQLGEQANRVGLTVDAFASLRFAAEQSDVSQEMFASSMDKLNKQLGDMTVGKGGEFLSFLNEISPTFAKQMKNAKGTEAAMSLLTDAFAKIDDPARRATLAAHAFGKSNLQMGEFLFTGNAAIREQQAEFMRLFGSQEASARAAGELDNATRKTETAFLGLRMAAAGALFPALTKVANVLTEFMVKHRDGISAWAEKSGAAITEWVDNGGFDRLVQNLSDVAGGIGKVIDFLGPMGTAAAVGAVAFAPLISNVASLGVSLIGVMPQIIAFSSWVGGGLVTAATAGGVAIKGFGATLAAASVPIAAVVFGLAGLGLGIQAVYENWDELVFIVKDWGNTIKWAVIDAWNFVSPYLEKLRPVWDAAKAAGTWLTTPRTIDGPVQPPTSGVTASEARPGQVSSQANVSVSFANLPAGARVSSESSGQPVDLSLGYSVQP
jgi:hypothetical protein